MGNKDPDQVDETVSLPEADSATPLEGQATAELEDVVVVEDVERGTTSIAHGDQPTASIEGNDVFVILPEADAGDVPFVETHAVEEPEYPTERSGMMENETEGTGSSLQQIQEDLEDELLTEPAPETSQELTATLGGDTAGDDFDLHAGGGSIGSVGEAPRRSWLRVALPAAAALLLGVGAALYYFPTLQQAAQGIIGAQTTSGATPVAVSTPATDPKGSGSSKSPVDLAAAAKEAFRTKVQLAVRLGFGGENQR